MGDYDTPRGLKSSESSTVSVRRALLSEAQRADTREYTIYLPEDNGMSNFWVKDRLEGTKGGYVY